MAEIVENSDNLLINYVLWLDMKIDASKIMAEIKRIRAEKGLKSYELAEKSGISKGYYSQLEKGDRSLDFDLFNQICKALDISAVELIIKTHQMEGSQADLDKQTIEAIANILDLRKKNISK